MDKYTKIHFKAEKVFLNKICVNKNNGIFFKYCSLQEILLIFLKICREFRFPHKINTKS